MIFLKLHIPPQCNQYIILLLGAQLHHEIQSKKIVVTRTYFFIIRQKKTFLKVCGVLQIYYKR